MKHVTPSPLMIRLLTILDASRQTRFVQRLPNLFLIIMIVVNVLANILGTVPEIGQRYGKPLAYINQLSLGVFILEYAARVYITPVRPGYGFGWRNFVRYLLSPLAIIDLLVIISLLIPGSYALTGLRGLRLLKLLSLLDFSHYSDSFQILLRVFRERLGELLVTAVLSTVLIVMSASLLYEIESSVRTPGFESMPQAMWWAVLTLTAGEGMISPATPLGKFVAALIMVFSVGFIALPAGLIATGIATEVIQRHRSIHQPPMRCPHCGEVIPAQVPPATHGES